MLTQHPQNVIFQAKKRDWALSRLVSKHYITVARQEYLEYLEQSLRINLSSRHRNPFKVNHLPQINHFLKLNLQAGIFIVDN